MLNVREMVFWVGLGCFALIAGCGREASQDVTGSVASITPIVVGETTVEDELVFVAETFVNEGIWRFEGAKFVEFEPGRLHPVGDDELATSRTHDGVVMQGWLQDFGPAMTVVLGVDGRLYLAEEVFGLAKIDEEFAESGGVVFTPGFVNSQHPAVVPEVWRQVIALVAAGEKSRAEDIFEQRGAEAQHLWRGYVSNDPVSHLAGETYVRLISMASLALQGGHFEEAAAMGQAAGKAKSLVTLDPMVFDTEWWQGQRYDQVILEDAKRRLDPKERPTLDELSRLSTEDRRLALIEAMDFIGPVRSDGLEDPIVFAIYCEGEDIVPFLEEVIRQDDRLTLTAKGLATESWKETELQSVAELAAELVARIEAG